MECHPAEFWPPVEEVPIGEDRVGLAELGIHQLHHMMDISFPPILPKLKLGGTPAGIKGKGRGEGQEGSTDLPKGQDRITEPVKM